MIGKAIFLTSASALVALAASGSIGADTGASRTAGITQPPCEVVSRSSGNMIAFDAIYHAKAPSEGYYQLAVRSRGGSNSTTINQGGGFSLSQAGSVSLGTVTVNGNAAYDVTLRVEANGQSYVCEGPSGKHA